MSSAIKWLILKRAEITFWEENCAMCWLNPQGLLFLESHMGFTHEEHAQSARVIALKPLFLLYIFPSLLSGAALNSRFIFVVLQF